MATSVSGYKEIIDVGYDILNLSENVDFMTVNTYDYHGAWENQTGHVSPLYSYPGDQFPEYSTVSIFKQFFGVMCDRAGKPNKATVGKHRSELGAKTGFTVEFVKIEVMIDSCRKWYGE